MKKLLALILVAGLTLSLVGCASDEPTSESAPADGAPAASEIKVAYIAKNTVDTFHATLNGAAEVALDAYVADGTIADWQLFDGLTDPITQVNLIEDAINAGFNFVVFLPAEGEGSAPVVTRCKEESIPCIVVNSKTSNTDADATAFVGSDDVFAGEMMANFVKDQIPDGGKYAHMMGIVGNSAQKDRGQGILNILGEDPNWESVGDFAADWSADNAVKFATDAISANGDDLKAIICDNDDMSSAVQAYCNSIGREDIVCIGVDGNPGPVGMVKEGSLRSTVLQDGASQVTEAIKLIPQIASGTEITEDVMVPFVLVTPENVDQYIK